MSQLIGIFDGGYTKDSKGRTVSAIHFKITTGEGKPDVITAHCMTAYKDTIIKNLRRLAFQNDNPTEDNAQVDDASPTHGVNQ